jgi:TATA-box binding protein (TBP) (component of TFIID and TFIIIB)
MFPSGVRYQPYADDRQRCALIFPSGRCVLTGCLSEQEVFEMGAHIKHLLLRFKKI